MTTNTNTSAAAAARLAKGFQVGDFVLFGDAVLKVRAPLPAGYKGGHGDGYARTKVAALGEVLAVTPTGLLRVRNDHGQVLSLDARTTKNAERLTGTALALRQACLPGWEG